MSSRRSHRVALALGAGSGLLSAAILAGAPRPEGAADARAGVGQSFEYELTVTVPGGEAGSVSSAPPGITCEPVCSAGFPPGTEVRLTAEPGPDATFAGWTGACTGTGPCTVTMTGPRSVGATFTFPGTPVPVADGPQTVSLATSQGEVEVTLTDVWSAGSLDATVECAPASTIAPPPFGMRFTPGCLFSLRAYGALYYAGLQVCLPYDEGALSRAGLVPAALRLVRHRAGYPAWIPDAATTTTTTTAGPRACGDPGSVDARMTFAADEVLARYLAEGATSTFFDVRFALLNPTERDTVATLQFQRRVGEPLSYPLPVSARTRVTLDAKSVPGLQEAEFSTLAAADTMLVVNRTMSWDTEHAYGSHAETAMATPNPNLWYLAEGATHSGFDLFYLLQNGSPTPVTVQVQYLLPGGVPFPPQTLTIAGYRRENIWVNHVPGLEATDVSAIIRVVSPPNGAIIVERAMYRDCGTTHWAAGHGSMAVNFPSRDWFLAEGATGPYFDLFLLFANPNTFPVTAEVGYLLDDGSRVDKMYALDPLSRRTVWVDNEDPRLAAAAVSSVVHAREGGIVVERAMWWPGPTPASWTEAHNSPGATASGTMWALAEGENGGPRLSETYILIANVSSEAGQARVTLVFDDGTSVEKVVALLPHSRRTIDVAWEAGFEASRGRRFGAIVESLGTPAAPIVVERAMYSSDGGVPTFWPYWPAGTNALATRLR